MAKAYRFRHVNQAAGAFVLGTLALLALAVLMTGHAQQWFQPVRRLTIILPAEGSLGLGPGAEVFILGVSVGTVDDIAPDPSGHMRADVKIRSDYGQFLHADSTATIRKTFGVAGDAYIDISRGSGPPLAASGAVISASTDLAPSEMLGDVLVRLRDEGVPMLKQVQATMAEFRNVAADLHDPEGHLQQTLAHADRIAEGVERGDGVAGKLFADPTMARQMDETLAKVNASLDEATLALKEARTAATSVTTLADSGNSQMKDFPAVVKQTQDALREAQELLKDARRTSARLPDTLAALNRTLDTFPALVAQTQETLRQTQRLVEGAQKNWLVRGYVAPEQTGGRIRPDQIVEPR